MITYSLIVIHMSLLRRRVNGEKPVSLDGMMLCYKASRISGLTVPDLSGNGRDAYLNTYATKYTDNSDGQYIIIGNNGATKISLDLDSELTLEDHTIIMRRTINVNRSIDDATIWTMPAEGVATVYEMLAINQYQDRAIFPFGEIRGTTYPTNRLVVANKYHFCGREWDTPKNSGGARIKQLVIGYSYANSQRVMVDNMKWWSLAIFDRAISYHDGIKMAQILGL